MLRRSIDLDAMRMVWLPAASRYCSIQISLPAQLLEYLDHRPETREVGRSVVIRRGLTVYFDLDRERTIDDAYARAYGGKADDVLAEFGPLMRGQPSTLR